MLKRVCWHTLAIALLAWSWLFSGAALAQGLPSPLTGAYQLAIQDAAIVETGENANTLTAITPDNPNLVWNADKTKVLVVTWKSSGSYEKFLKPNKTVSLDENYLTWVTTVPQVKKFCQRFLSDRPGASLDELNLRLKRYLGLNQNWQYDVFVQMWVSPQELFRPCVDPEVTDSQCNADFGAVIPVVKNIKDYPTFYKNLYYKSFRSALGVPWTGLGYTYDWDGTPAVEVGASEFILVPGATYEIEQVQGTQDYCHL